MKNIAAIEKKICDLPQILSLIASWRIMGKTVAFTNGCFDILHEGHIYSLSQAAKQADYLVVGVNADASVRKLKGHDRPINNQHSRSLILASLLITDAVIIFEEDTPLNIINAIKPDVLVKGGDYKIEQIVGAKEVIANGGRVEINPIIPDFSTSKIIDAIKRLG